MLLFPVKKKRVGEPMSSVQFDLPKTIKIELPHKTFELLVSEILWNDFSFHSSNVEHIDAGSR